jgi:hypothetical protein
MTGIPFSLVHFVLQFMKFQGGALGMKQKAGLESQYETIAEKLTSAEFGYKAHMVGK